MVNDTAKGEIQPQETRLGADNKIYELPASKTLEADPFDDWFKNHVICDDMFNSGM